VKNFLTEDSTIHTHSSCQTYRGFHGWAWRIQAGAEGSRLHQRLWIVDGERVRVKIHRTKEKVG